MLTATMENVTAKIVTDEELFYQTGEFWVSTAFICVVLLCFFPITNFIKNLINKRIQFIKKELQDAESLKIDAQNLYAEYERKYQNTDNEISEIIANQQEVIKQTKEQKIRDLDRSLKQKEQETEAKIRYAFMQAKEEINTKIVEQAVALLSKTISSKLTKKDHDALINQSISKLQKIHLD